MNLSNKTYIDWQSVADRPDPNDQWKKNHYPSSPREWWKKLDRYNGGRVNGKWVNKRYWTWKENNGLIQSCSAQMSLTIEERGKARSLFHRLKGNRFGTHKEVYAIATCLYVVETNTRDERRAHPNCSENPEKPNCKAEEFKLEPLCLKFGITEKWLRKAYGRIERWVRFGDLGKAPVFDEEYEDVSLDYEQQMTGYSLSEAE